MSVVHFTANFNGPRYTVWGVDHHQSLFCVFLTTIFCVSVLVKCHPEGPPARSRGLEDPLDFYILTRIRDSYSCCCSKSRGPKGRQLEVGDSRAPWTSRYIHISRLLDLVLKMQGVAFGNYVLHGAGYPI